MLKVAMTAGPMMVAMAVEEVKAVRPEIATMTMQIALTAKAVMSVTSMEMVLMAWVTRVA